MVGKGLGKKVAGAELGAGVGNFYSPQAFQVGFDKGKAIAGVDGHDFQAVLKLGIDQFFSFVLSADFKLVPAGGGVTVDEHVLRPGA